MARVVRVRANAWRTTHEHAKEETETNAVKVTQDPLKVAVCGVVSVVLRRASHVGPLHQLHYPSRHSWTGGWMHARVNMLILIHATCLGVGT